MLKLQYSGDLMQRVDLIREDPDAGDDWRQGEKGTTEGEMVGWDHRLDGHEFEQVLGVRDGQESLACCSPWGHRVRHNWTDTLQHAHHQSCFHLSPCSWPFTDFSFSSGNPLRNIGLHIYFKISIYIFFGLIPRSEIAGSYVVLFFFFFNFNFFIFFKIL